jgi:hypothetical protein
MVDHVLHVSLEKPIVRAGHPQGRFEELGDHGRLFVRRLSGRHRPYQRGADTADSLSYVQGSPSAALEAL